jgi:hypothetical protein
MICLQYGNQINNHQKLVKIAAGGSERSSRALSLQGTDDADPLHFLVLASKRIHSPEEAVNTQFLSPSHFLLDSQIHWIINTLQEASLD